MTSSRSLITDAALELYDRLVNRKLLVRRITIVANHLIDETAAKQQSPKPQKSNLKCRKTACLGGFSSFFILVFVFKAIAVQRWFQGKKSDWSMSKDSR